MHFLQAINSDISVLIVCNKTGGTIKGDKKLIIISVLIIELKRRALSISFGLTVLYILL